MDAGGEVTAIDSAGFGPVVIAKPVTITSPDGVEAGIVATSPAVAPIEIDTAGDVFLRGLTIEGNNISPDGISLFGAGGLGKVSTLGIVHCVIRHFTHDGIYLQPTGTLNVSILDTIASNNGWHGIELSPSGTGTIAGVIDHSTTTSNGFDGMVVWGANSTGGGFTNAAISIFNSVSANNGRNGVTVYTPQSGLGSPGVVVTVRDTSANQNTNDGFESTGSNMIFSRSEAILNGNNGIEIGANLSFSFGDNYVRYNYGSDVYGALQPYKTY